MSTRTNSKTAWAFASAGQGQDALWGAGALAFPPVGTSRNDVLRGTNGNDSFHGQGGNDTIYGRGGIDIIVGGAGNDKLYGGAGQDTFFFFARLNARTNVDKIMDFKSADDVMTLRQSYFKKVSGYGELTEAVFHVGKKAHDADDRIIYDKATGSLYYDADGTGSAAKIKFAVLANKATITHQDFFIS